MPRRIEGLVVAAGLVLVCCGGQSVADRAAPDGAATPAGSGGSPNLDGCDDASAPQAGCDGEGGEQAVAADGRVRTACNLDVTVNRRGQPVAICFQIK